MLARGQRGLVHVQLGIHIRFFLIGHAGVDDAGDDHIPAARHLAHSGNPVLTVHHIKFAVPEADHHRGEFPVIPLPDDLIHPLLLHRTLVGKAGSQLAGGEGTDSAGVTVRHLGGREKGLLLRFGRGLFSVIVHFFMLLFICFSKSWIAVEIVPNRSFR